MDAPIRTPEKIWGMAPGKIISLNKYLLLVLYTLAIFIWTFVACLTPYDELTIIMNVVAHTLNRIFEISPIPKKSRNNGKSATAGMDLKKSIANSSIL